MGRKRSKEDKETEEEVLEEFKEPDEDDVDPKIAEEMKIIEATEPKSELEIALTETLKRRELYIKRLTAEVSKLKDFVRKRKQTYKRKRKDEGAPTRALSAYNIFVQDRFAKLSKENEQALKSADAEAYLKRVPPSSLVASTGNAWKALSAEEKQVYEERAKEDRKRYEEQMSKYQPPEKGSNRKRNKTGYNMFFSAHVMRLKSAEGGVPSERGSVARLVGNAWKQLSTEEKQYYEREADKHNGQNPLVQKDEDEEDMEDANRAAMEYGHMQQPHDMQQMQATYAQQMVADPRYAAYYAPYMQAQQGQQVAYDYRQRGYQAYPQGHPYDQRNMGTI